MPLVFFTPTLSAKVSETKLIQSTIPNVFTDFMQALLLFAYVYYVICNVFTWGRLRQALLVLFALPKLCLRSSKNWQVSQSVSQSGQYLLLTV